MQELVTARSKGSTGASFQVFYINAVEQARSDKTGRREAGNLIEELKLSTFFDVLCTDPHTPQKKKRAIGHRRG